ncbi:MAG TPA: T9SS type A sorting domain-containing protein [Ignavibacteriaceae bacterium]|nr:T9SS type A sorting domain-containing protein [Ignavibacteriaceae bacterium]
MKKIFVLFFLLTFASFLFPQTGWTEVTSGTTAELQGIDWASATVVWVSAGDGSVYRSTDGGTTWTPAGTTGGGAGAYGIAALDAQTAVVCFGPNSGAGKIWRTTNGGTNWVEVYSNASAWFNFVDNVNSTTLWAQSDPVGGSFLILKSIDGGATWNPISSTVPMATGAGAFLSFYRIGNKLWFGTSTSNKIFYSNNGIDGPWTYSTATVNNIGTVAFNGIDGNGLAAFWNNSTTINRTSDGGQTWAAQTTAIGAPSGFDYIVGTNSAWAATANGIWRTTDNGATWTQDVTLSTGLNWVKFYNDANVGLAVGPGGKIYKSTMSAIIPNTLTHTTGNISATFFNTGYIGHDFSGAVGGGVVAGTYPDAMYTAGIMIGDPVTGVNGMVGSFTSSNLPVIQDNVKEYGMYGFTSNATWNQIASAGYKDNLATAPFGLMVHQESFSAANDKFVIVRYRIVNNTLTAKNNLRVGLFADWDVGLTNYAKNRGGVDPSTNMVYQYLNTAPINDPNYYGLVALNGMTGGKVAADFAWTTTSLRTDLFNFLTTVDTNPITADADYRSYIGAGPFNIPVGGEQLVGFAIVYGSSLQDLQANALLAYQKGSSLVPVELTSFAASVNGNIVDLKWTTATEINNQGFEIERRIVDINSPWVTVGFKSGAGSTTSETNYSFSEDISLLGATKFAYRLKQIDYNGQFKYSDEVMVDYTAPVSYSLTQNYPNPFNPSTTIKYQLPSDKFVSLKVFNSLGEEVQTLVNGLVKAGSHQVEFNANGLSSGIYLYVLRVGEDEYVKTMKMILMK